jgi:diguanylate cyclase (GGDEF)-like protein
MGAPTFLRDNRRLIGVSVVILTIGIALLATVTHVAFHEAIEVSAESEAAVVSFQALTYQLSASEWEAIAEGRFSPGVTESVRSTHDDMARLMRKLEELDPKANLVQPIRQAYEAYSLALDGEFKALVTGDVDQAALIDEEQVDPAFETLSETLSSAKAVYHERARQADQIEIWGFGVVLILASMGTALLFWRYEKAEARISAAKREQESAAIREKDLRVLSEMGQRLRVCKDLSEAHDVVGEHAGRLFPDQSGALYVLDAGRDILDAVSTWGARSHDLQPAFTPDECWALRLEQAHVVLDPYRGSVCEHVVQSVPGSYLCVPLVALGETLGILYLEDSEPIGIETTDSQSLAAASRQELAITLAAHVSLALTDIRLENVLQHQATHDALSGLFNRRYMEETLERELSRAARRNTPVGVIMLDIDHFKRINDGYGHAAGDSMIVAFARLLRGMFRGEDVPCRHGGEEFVLVLPGASSSDACRRAEQLREETERMTVEHRGQRLPSVTVSLGVAVYDEHGRTGEGLLHAADAAMYRAKDEGRNRLALAQASDRSTMNLPDAESRTCMSGSGGCEPVDNDGSAAS